ncbi:condensation domain-containing protein [Streptomyces roseolus]
MLMTFLDDYEPRPGTLVELRVPDEVIARARHAPVHPVPPSPVQENHLLRRLANIAAGRPQAPWVGLAFEVQGAADTEALAAALKKWVLRHDTVLTWFSAERSADGGEAAGTSLVRHMVDASDVDIRPVTIGAYDSTDALRDHLRAQFQGSTDPLRWPPFTAGVVLRESSSTVYFAIDHAHSDAYSVVLVFHELRTLYQAEVDGIEASLPAAGSYIEAGAEERERAAAIQADAPEVQSWITFLLSGPMPSFPLDLGVPPGESRPSRAFELDLLTGAEADAFAKACREHGAGFSAGVMAVLGFLHRELGGRAEYRGLSVVHTRNDSRWHTAQGWFITLVPVTFPLVEEGRRLTRAELLDVAGAAFRSACKLARVSPLRVAELAGIPLQGDDSSVLPIVSYIDGRPVPGSRDWDAAECNGLADSSPSDEVLMWVNRRWDRTYVKVTYPDTPEAAANVPYFFGRFREVLREIAEAGM